MYNERMNFHQKRIRFSDVTVNYNVISFLRPVKFIRIPAKLILVLKHELKSKQQSVKIYALSHTYSCASKHSSLSSFRSLLFAYSDTNRSEKTFRYSRHEVIMAFHATQNEKVTLSGQTIPYISLECDVVGYRGIDHGDPIHLIIHSNTNCLVCQDLFSISKFKRNQKKTIYNLAKISCFHFT